MNKALLIIALLLCVFAALGQSQLENSYFAAWEDIPSEYALPGVYQEPVGDTWATSNEASMAFTAIPSVKKTSDSYIGEYAALIETILIGKDLQGNDIIGSGTLFTGKFKIDMIYPLKSTKFGVPFTDKPVYFKGYYKYLPVSGDSCRVASYLTKWNSSTHKRDTIAAAGFTWEESKATVTTYTEFDISYHYYSALAPDSITVIFASSADGANFNGAIGSKLYIDEVSLEYYPLSVDDKLKNKEISIFPNPVDENFTVQSLPGKCRDLKVYNSRGQLILSRKIQSDKETITSTGMAAGLYYYSVSKTDGTLESGKFYKK